jgi:hypothetical protein
MSLVVNSGYKSLNLYFESPAGNYYIDDNTTSGYSQLEDNSLRTDTEKLYVWISTENTLKTSLSTDPLASQNLIFSGNFQNNVNISTIKVAGITENLADNKVYYICYAITSKIDPTEIVVSDQFTGTTLDVSLEIQGWLTRDPVEVEADADGDVPDPFPTTYFGTFTVYKYSENITTSNDVQYEVVSGSSTGGVTATIITTNGDTNKGQYKITGITDLVGTVTLKATYTDPNNTARILVIEKILNVSKRRPGASASIVELTGSGLAFVKTANGGTIFPSSLTLSATPTNVLSPEYTWYVAGTTDTEIIFDSTNDTTSNNYSEAFTRDLTKLNELTVSSSFFTGETTPSSKIIRVKVTSTVEPDFEVSDTFTLYYLQEGSDAYALGLQNENQSVSFTGNTSDSSILNTATPIASQLYLVRGTTLIDPADTDPLSVNSPAYNKITSIAYAVTETTGIDADNISITNQGAISILRNTTVFPPDSFLGAEITFTVTVTFLNGSTLVLAKKLTINAVFDGQSGTAYWLVNSPKLLIKQKDGTLNNSTISWTAKQSISGTVSTYTTGYFNVYKGTSLLTLNTDYTVLNGIVTVSTLDATASYYRAELYSDSAKTKLIDQDDIPVYEEGSDGVIVFNDNQNHTLTRNSVGEIGSYLATGTYFSVQQGTQVFAANITGAIYSWNSTTKKLSISNTLTSGQFYIKSITFGTNLTVNSFIPTSGWADKFSIRDTTDLIFEDWSNITINNTATQSTVEFEIEYKKLDSTLATHITTQRISIVKDASTIIVDVENDSHQIPFTTSNVGIYTYSGTKIQAFDSNQELQYKSPGTTLLAGQWKITERVGTGITPATIPTETLEKYAQVGDHSNMTAPTANIAYTITARTFRDTLVEGILAGQTFTKVANATAIYRIVNATSIIKFNNGTYSSLTVSAQKLEGGTDEVFNGWLSYQIKESDGTLQSETSRQQTNLTINLLDNTDASSVIVRLYKEQTGGNAVDTADIIVIPQAADGQDGNLQPWIVKTENYTAVPGDRIIANTENGSFTINLPANPSIGASVTITDGWDFAQNNLIIGRNGSLIVNELQQGEAANINLDVMNTTYEFIYTGTVRGWDFTATAGPKGDRGTDANLLVLKSSDQIFTYESSTAVQPLKPDISITFEATKQNIYGTITWTAKAYDEQGVELGTVTLTDITANTAVLTPTNFNTVTGVTNRLSIRSVKVTASMTAENLNELFEETITILRLDNGSDAIIHRMDNESHILAATTLGEVGSYSDAYTPGYIYRGAVNETMLWTISKVDSTGLITTLTQPTAFRTGGVISSISGAGTSASPWQATITEVSTTGLSVGDTISALENNTGRLYGGIATSVTIYSISGTTIVYRVIGGTTPIAGPVGGIAKGLNRYLLTTTSLANNIDTGTSTVTATKNNQTLDKIFSVAKSKDGSVFVILDLTNDNVNVATKNDGSDGDYTLATTNVTVYVGDINVLPIVSAVTITPSAGVTFKYTKNGTASAALTTQTSIPVSPQINTLSLAITNIANANNNGKLTVKVTYLSVDYTQEFTVGKNKEGPDGQPAQVFSLEADSELLYDPNQEEFVPSSIVFSAYKTVGTGLKELYTATGVKIRLEHSANNSSWSTIGSDSQASSRTLTTSTLPKTAKFLRYSLINTTTTPETILDREVDVISLDGRNSSTIVVDVENDTHQIPFSADGTAVSYNFSGTNIQVFDNNTELTYTTSNTLTTARTWTFTAITGTNITPNFTISSKPGVVSGQKACTVANHSAMTSDAAKIVYTIKALSIKGIEVTGLTGSQTFTKVLRTAIFRIIGATSIKRTRANVYNSITVKGQKIEGTTTSDYGVLTSQLLPGGSESSKSAGSSLTIAPTTGSNVTNVKVKLYHPTDNIVLDETDIAVTQDGLDAASIVVDVINDTHDIPSDSGGTPVTYDYSGTAIKVFSNYNTVTTELQYQEWTSGATLADNKWWIRSISGSGITAAAIPAVVSGQLFAEVGNHSAMTTATAKVTYNIEAKPTGQSLITGLQGVQTFAKVNRTAIYRLVNIDPIVVAKDGTIKQSKISSQKIDGTTVTTPFQGYITQQLDSATEGNRVLSTAAGIDTTATATTKVVTVRLYESSSGGSVLDRAEIKVITDGTDGLPGVSISYSNDVHLVPVTGTTNWSGSGGLIRVYDGPNLLNVYSTTLNASYPPEANKGTYRLDITKVSGNTLTVGALSGNATEVTLAQWAGTLTQPTVYRITAYIRTSTNKTTVVSTDATIVPTNENTIYSLDVNPGIVSKAWNSNTYTPSSLDIKFYRTIGKDTAALFNPTKINVATSSDGTNFGTGTNYTSFSTTGTMTYTISETVKVIRVQAYVDTTLVDEEKVVVSQEVKGSDALPASPTKAVYLEANGTSWYRAANNSVDPTHIKVTAKPQNLVIPQYKWVVTNGQISLDNNTWVAGNSYDYFLPSGYSNVWIRPTTTATSVLLTFSVQDTEGYTFTTSVTAPVVRDGVAVNGKTAVSGYLFQVKDTQPAKPSGTINYDIASGTVNLGSAGADLRGWSTTAPSISLDTNGNAKTWSLLYSGIENTPGAGFTPLVFGDVTSFVSFTGLVTFTKLGSAIGADTTFIDGSNIKTGTISLNRLSNQGTLDVKNSTSQKQGTFQLGENTSILARGPNDAQGNASYINYKGVGAFENSPTVDIDRFALLAASYNKTPALGVGSVLTAEYGASAIFVKSNKNNLSGSWRVGTVLATNNAAIEGNYRAYYETTANNLPNLSTFALATSTYGGRFEKYDGIVSDTSPVKASTLTTSIELANANYAAYLFGNVGSFTGAHDAYIDPNEEFDLGDIVIDLFPVSKKTINDTITKVTLTSSINQKSVVGVISNYGVINSPSIPVAIAIDQKATDGPGDTKPMEQYIEIHTNSRYITINSIGEGLVNVCGEGGNIDVGDLITSSSMLGKGMKQHDDIIRNYTVAKSREAVVFTSSTEIKQIACIYLCG